MMRQSRQATEGDAGSATGARGRAWVEVDLGALRRNAAAVAARAGVPLLPMIKADAYGVGAVAVARALDSIDPWGFGIATLEEGAELRAAGIARRLMIFTPLLPADLPAARALGIVPVMGDATVIAAWIAGGRDPWHLGIDTGMGRAGVRWNAVGALAPLLRQLPPEGAATHFHSADIADDPARDEQERRFARALDKLPARPLLLHAENSPAVERRAPSRWSLARPGVFLYGVSAGADSALRAEPVVSVRARVVEMRRVDLGEGVSYGASWRAPGPRTIATLAIGYGDGYRRGLSNRGVALIGGRRVPVVGLVTMDMTMLDVTDIACAPGDIATLVGADGDDLLTVADVATAGELSPYELLTGLRVRMPRLHHEATT